MYPEDSVVEQLLPAVVRGDQSATAELWERHRGPLLHMVAARIHPALLQRVDPSDVVQEVLAEVTIKLAAYLRHRPLPFYPWLRSLTQQRLALLHRHQFADKRSPTHERYNGGRDGSSLHLADWLADSGTSPSSPVQRNELRERLYDALDQMSQNDREVLTMHYLEQLSFAEIAKVLKLAEGTVKVQHFRAMERLRTVLGNNSGLQTW
jgi:RNA polymerase sigma-70 factor (subfamily 1)